jgi:hypothetical protein
LNGFPVYYNIDGEAEQISNKIASYLITGENKVEVFLANPMPPNETEKQFFLCVRKVEKDQAPADGKPILDYTWDPGKSEQMLEPEGKLKSVFKYSFNVDEVIGPWAWEKAKPIGKIYEAENDIYMLLTEMVQKFNTIDTKGLLEKTSLRSKEVGLALGVPLERMKQGLSKGIGQLSKASDYKVTLPERGETIFWWNQENRWCVPRRTDGTAAIQITSEGMTQPFEMVIGQLNGDWTILR